MGANRIFNIYFTKFCSKTSCQLTCIVIGSVCCTKAWHGNCCNAASFLSKSIKCQCCHKDCQCRIKAAGNTYHCMIAVCMFQTFFQSHGLNFKNFCTSFLPSFCSFRNKRRGIDGSVQHQRVIIYRKIDFQIVIVHRIFCNEGCILATVTHQTFQINICVSDTALIFF